MYLYETCLKYEMSEEATWAGLKKHLRGFLQNFNSSNSVKGTLS